MLFTHECRVVLTDPEPEHLKSDESLHWTHADGEPPQTGVGALQVVVTQVPDELHVFTVVFDGQLVGAPALQPAQAPFRQ